MTKDLVGEIRVTTNCCSVTQLCPTLCYPMNCSMPGFPVLHYLPEFAQTHVHWVGDAIQPSHPLSPPCPPLKSFPALGSFPISWLFTLGGQSTGASASASVLPMNIQGQFPSGFTGLILSKSKGLSRVFSNIISKASILWHSASYGPTFTSVHDYWKNHSFD